MSRGWTVAEAMQHSLDASATGTQSLIAWNVRVSSFFDCQRMGPASKPRQELSISFEHCSVDVVWCAQRRIHLSVSTHSAVDINRLIKTSFPIRPALGFQRTLTIFR